ncbi:hypothetical protein FPZ49_33150 [Paenibacillus cremeus]|uniref:Probable pectate lyase C n=2 Tax=Paenibacillus cremeus TaxID=2163881 RepID=A0A559JKC8_9BACL|nr:fibronectin type III domain-containing protein [Paenibacillus cremeus]TVY00333.1 hypothetical protein FPZ49_33150 [Paenibacillus cremeus]
MAGNSFGNSGNSNEATATTPAPQAPAAPANVRATAGNGQVTLSWDAVSGAASYHVQWSTDGLTYTNLASGLTATSYLHTQVTNGTKYYYKVAAVNGAGEGTASLANATPNAVVSVPAGSVDAYNLTGFASGTTGGGNIPDTDPKYIKVYNDTDFAKAINRKNGYKVVEIMNDLNLGWNELSAEAKSTAGSLIVTNAAPLTHPVLKVTGVSKVYLDTVTNMTIFSANGSKIKHAGLDIKHSSNIIIRNLEFDELWEWDEATKGNYDKQDWDYMTVEDDTKVWIDHCTFYKSYDGGIDIKQGASGVTISWSNFKGDDRSANSWVTQQINAMEANRSAYPMYNGLRDMGFTPADIIAVSAGQKKQHLVGATEFDAKNPNLQVTLHHNYYQNVNDRMPRLRGGNAHAYNIVMDSAGNREASRRISAEQAAAITAKGYHFGVTSNGAISTEGGAVLVENSHIIDVVYPIRNNQVDPAQANYTGKILARDTIYSMDGTTFRGNSDTEGSPLAPVPAPPIAFSWSGMTELPYTYTPDDPSTLIARLTASDGSGSGKLTWNKSNWLLTTGYSTEGMVPTAPAKVSGLVATPTNNGQVSLKWNAVSGAASYTVKRSTVNGSGYQTLTTVQAPGTSYTDASVTVGTPYYYVVSATNDIGVGDDSSQASVTPAIVVVVAPAAPTNLSASAGNAQVTITWRSVAGAASYKIKRSTTSGGPYTEITSGVTGTSYKDTTVTNGTDYYYVVSTVNEGGESPNSSQAAAKPVAPADVTLGMSLIVNDNFDDQASGVSPAGYVVSEAGGTVQISNTPNATNKSIFINDTSTSGFSQISKNFTAQTQKVIAQVDFMQPTKVNSTKILRLQPALGGTTPAVSIETNGGNISYRNAGDSYTVLSSYTAGTWYTVQVVVDIAAKKVDVYINGVLKIQQAAFYATNSSISLLEAYTPNGSAGGHYIDNVKIYAPSQAGGQEPGQGSGSGAGSSSGQAIAATLSSAQMAADHQSFSINYGLSHLSSDPASAIFAQDITFQYDPGILEFVSADALKTGLSIIKTDTSIPGKVRIMAAGLGASGAITADDQLIKLNWKVKGSGAVSSTTVSITQAQLANGTGDVTTASAASVNIPFVPGDVNGDGVVNIGDLGMMAAAYGLTSSSPQWNKNLDLNNDGVINIIDLAAVANLLP